jgi:predicted Na+-dependent transporter
MKFIQLLTGIIIICIIFTILFSINAGTNIMFKNNTAKIVSIVIPAVLGFFIIPTYIQWNYNGLYKYTIN